MTDPHDKHRDTQRKIHNYLSELEDEIGPAIVTDNDGSENIGGLLSEWIIVMSWIDPSDGQAYLTRVSSENLIGHHRDGLLYNGLNKFDG